jgi:hypothetical protein
MWIAHRAVFSNIALVVGLLSGVLLLAMRPLSVRRLAQAVLVPSAIVGAFIGLTATRGMYLLWWERVGIAAWVTVLMSACLLGAAGTLSLLQRVRSPRSVQVVGAIVVAGAIFALTRAFVAVGRDDLLHRAIRDAFR